jgi:membrane-associated phospholipid phosphatase
MLSGAHFLSDVLAGAVLGYLSAVLVGFLQPRRP